MTRPTKAWPGINQLTHNCIPRETVLQSKIMTPWTKGKKKQVDPPNSFLSRLALLVKLQHHLRSQEPEAEGSPLASAVSSPLTSKLSAPFSDSPKYI